MPGSGTDHVSGDRGERLKQPWSQVTYGKEEFRQTSIRRKKELKIAGGGFHFKK